MIIILTGAFLFSLAYSFYFKLQPSVDARAYNNIAINLVNGYGYTENPNLSPEEELSISRMGPGYELFLAIIYKIFGIHLELIWVINALLFVASGFLLYKIAWKLFNNEKIAVLAVGLYLFYIDVLQATAMLLTENLYIFLLILVFYLLIKLPEKKNLFNQIIFALVNALTVIVRSTYLLTYLFVATFSFIKKNYRLIVISFIFIILFFLPWGIRNYRVYHKFMLSNVTLGYNLWTGNNLQSQGEQMGTPEIDSYLEKYGIIKTAEHGLSEYKNYLLNNPGHFIKLQLIKTIKYFSLVRVSAFWFHLHGVFKLITALWSGIFASFIFIFGSFGVYQLIKEKKQTLLILFIVSFPLSVIPFLVENRYRWPIYPFLAMTAAYGFYKIINKEIKWRPIIIFTLIFIFITLVDIIISYNDVISHLNSFQQ